MDLVGRSPGRALRLAVCLALAILGAPVAVTQAAEPAETGRTRYEVFPDRGVVAVSIDLSVPAVEPGRPTTMVWIESTARNRRFSVDRGSLETTQIRSVGAYDLVRLEALYLPRGHAPTISVRYDLTGGGPRSDIFERVTPAFVSFCVFAHGRDGGYTSIDVHGDIDWPTAGDTGWSEGGYLDGDDWVISFGQQVDDTATFYDCLAAPLRSGYEREQFVSPGGRKVVLASYPGDEEWRSYVRNALPGELRRVESIVGRPLPGARTIVVREVPHSRLDGYGGLYYTDDGVIELSEHYGDPTLLGHELAHAWFNQQRFDPVWLTEGYAEWIGSFFRCVSAPPPNGGAADLDNWLYLTLESTDADRALVDYQYAAACTIVRQVMSRTSPEAGRDVLDALFDGSNAYGVDLVPYGPTKPVTWRRWLDVIDEVGYVARRVPDLDFTQELLASYGVADDPLGLIARSSARALYHELREQASDWTLPRFIRQDLSDWNFGAALTATRAISDARTAAQRTAELLPEVDALAGPVRSKVEAASAVPALTEAKDLAEAQAVAAEKVAAALQVVAAEPDLFAGLGLIGVDAAEHADPAVAAVARADAAEAARLAETMIATRDAAAQSGLVRAFLGAAMLLAGVFRVRRWQQRRPVREETLAG